MSKHLDAATREKIKRMAIFEPCVSKEHLHTWIKVYLGLDLPNTIVCDDDVTNPPSNSSPMDLIWEIYSKARYGRDEMFQKVLAYAARDSFKTVACSVLEVLCLFHLNRNVAHMAAIEAQAAKCQQYIERYLQRPYLREFLTSKNKRLIEITRYVHPDGTIISPAEFEALPPHEKTLYNHKSNYMKVLVATLSGANSEHVPFLVLDELDLAPPKPLEEAKMIPAKGENGELPITFMTSSRKFAFGPVQKELDRAHKSRLQVRHWNLIDVSQRCPPSRHLPEEPKVQIYYSEKELRAISQEEYNDVPTEEKQLWFSQEGYAGCLKNCALFAVCRGRLATKQKSSSPLLKELAEVTQKFFDVSPDTAKAQLMCWKPSSEGLIYPYFSRERHMKTAAEMLEMITGEKPTGYVSKQALLMFMQQRGMTWHLGMDFGFTHNFACVLGALDGHRLFVVDVLSQAQLELSQKIEMCKGRYFQFDPTVYPDPAYPSDIKTFRRNGFRCKNFTKDVLLGIDAVRMKLMPGLGKEPEIFLLAKDEGCEKLASRILEYHWVIEKETERPTDVPTDENDDECDALRYLCQNLFGSKTKFTADLTGSAGVRTMTPSRENWMRSKIDELTHGSGSETVIRGRKGSFIFEA